MLLLMPRETFNPALPPLDTFFLFPPEVSYLQSVATLPFARRDAHFFPRISRGPSFSPLLARNCIPPLRRAGSPLRRGQWGTCGSLLRPTDHFTNPAFSSLSLRLTLASAYSFALSLDFNNLRCSSSMKAVPFFGALMIIDPSLSFPGGLFLGIDSPPIVIHVGV